MGDSTYAPDDIPPSTTAMAWSQDPAGDKMATEYVSPQEAYGSPDEPAPTHIGGYDQLDYGWLGYQPEQDLGGFDDRLPWYRRRVVLVAAAASAVAVGLLGVVLMTSHYWQVSTVPVDTSGGNTPSPMVPLTSMVTPPPHTVTAPTETATNSSGGNIGGGTNSTGGGTNPNSGGSNTNSGGTTSGETTGGGTTDGGTTGGGTTGGGTTGGGTTSGGTTGGGQDIHIDPKSSNAQ
jgi:hypothetical protein